MSILISLSPNTEVSDVTLAVRTLLTFRKWSKQEYVAVAEKVIQQLIPGVHGVLTSSGRSALHAILTTAGIGQGDEVIVQAFTCVAVPGAVTWSGAKPVYADIDPATYNLDPKAVLAAMTPRTRAIVVQHTFGIPGPIASLKQIAADNDLLLIEDLAHSLRAHTPPLTGYVGFLSFGRDKIVSSVFGGAVISADAAFIKQVAAVQNQLPLPPKWWVAQQLLHPIMLSIIKPTYYFGGKFLLVIFQRLRLLSKAVAADERQGKPPIFLQWRFSPALAILLRQQLEKLDAFTSRRLTRVEQYAARIGSVAQWRHLPLLRVPLRVPNKQEVLRQARKQHIMLGDWYNSAVEPCGVTDLSLIEYTPGSCPEAERAAGETINLPTYPTMDATASQRIINLIARQQATSQEKKLHHD